MLAPAAYPENEALAGYLEQQLSAIRASAHGLTEEQARLTPCRSALSIGGLVKHVTYVITGRLREMTLDEAGFALFTGSFALTPDETLAGALVAFDDAVGTYLADVRAVDPAAPAVTPPAPWDGVYAPTPSNERFGLLHHVEELARHAGHADIVREQIDGADAGALLMAMEGRPANDFVQPWAPPGA